MIIDDEENILKQVKDALETDDFSVLTAENSKKAFEIMDTKKMEDFGLILIDSSLPNSEKPALFSMQPGKKKNIDTTKIEDFLEKPFSKEQLIDFVKKRM